MSTAAIIRALLVGILWCAMPAATRATSPPVSVSRVLKSPSEFLGKTVVVEARVFSDRHHKMIVLDRKLDRQGIVMSLADGVHGDVDEFVDAVAREAGRANARGVSARLTATVIMRENGLHLSVTKVVLLKEIQADRKSVAKP